MPRNDLDKAYVSAEVLADMPNTPRFPPNAPRLVEILAFPSVQLLDVTGPLQVFATANEIAASGSKSVAPYLLRVVAAGGASVTTSSGLALLTQPLPPMESVPDTLLIAGGLAAAYRAQLTANATNSNGRCAVSADLRSRYQAICVDDPV